MAIDSTATSPAGGEADKEIVKEQMVPGTVAGAWRWRRKSPARRKKPLPRAGAVRRASRSIHFLLSAANTPVFRCAFSAFSASRRFILLEALLLHRLHA